MRDSRRVAMGFSDSIAKMGTCGSFFGPILDPKFGPGHVKMAKPWYQYIYFIFSPKSEPNIFILRRFF